MPRCQPVTALTTCALAPPAAIVTTLLCPTLLPRGFDKKKNPFALASSCLLFLALSCFFLHRVPPPTIHRAAPRLKHRWQPPHLPVSDPPKRVASVSQDTKSRTSYEVSRRPPSFSACTSTLIALSGHPPTPHHHKLRTDTEHLSDPLAGTDDLRSMLLSPVPLHPSAPPWSTSSGESPSPPHLKMCSMQHHRALVASPHRPSPLASRSGRATAT
jgi:hypothetical protein